MTNCMLFINSFTHSEPNHWHVFLFLHWLDWQASLILIFCPEICSFFVKIILNLVFKCFYGIRPMLRGLFCLLFSHYLHHFNFPVNCKGNSPHPLYILITIANILYKKKEFLNVHLHGRNAVYLCFHWQPWGKWLMSQPQRHCLRPSYATLQGSSIQSASVCHFCPPNNPW